MCNIADCAQFSVLQKANSNKGNLFGSKSKIYWGLRGERERDRQTERQRQTQTQRQRDREITMAVLHFIQKGKN